MLHSLQLNDITFNIMCFLEPDLLIPSVLLGLMVEFTHTNIVMAQTQQQILFVITANCVYSPITDLREVLHYHVVFIVDIAVTNQSGAVTRSCTIPFA